MQKVKAPEGMSSVSVGGEEYKVKDGFVNVPDSALPTLAQHGLLNPDTADHTKAPTPGALGTALADAHKRIQELEAAARTVPTEVAAKIKELEAKLAAVPEDAAAKIAELEAKLAEALGKSGAGNGGGASK